MMVTSRAQKYASGKDVLCFLCAGAGPPVTAPKDVENGARSILIVGDGGMCERQKSRSGIVVRPSRYC
jgi:hypothetical protein